MSAFYRFIYAHPSNFLNGGKSGFFKFHIPKNRIAQPQIKMVAPAMACIYFSSPLKGSRFIPFNARRNASRTLSNEVSSLESLPRSSLIAVLNDVISFVKVGFIAISGRSYSRNNK